MRVKRVEKFKKLRQKKRRNLILYAIVLPCTSIILGYIITLLVILPSINK